MSTTRTKVAIRLSMPIEAQVDRWFTAPQVHVPVRHLRSTPTDGCWDRSWWLDFGSRPPSFRSMSTQARAVRGLPICNLVLKGMALHNPSARDHRNGMRNTWNVDRGHSSIIFSIRHLLIAKVRGRFSRFGGTLDLDDA